MTGPVADFERAWMGKLADSLERVADAAARGQVMQGSEGLNDASPRDEVVAWTREAMGRLEALTTEQQQRDIMAGCACRYAVERLQTIREAYANNEDLTQAHAMLQEQFVGFLRRQVGLEEELVQEVLRRGWGVAGVLEGDTVIATKIPKSGNLREYLLGNDDGQKRELYCHCPRVREMLAAGETLCTGPGFLDTEIAYAAVWYLPLS